LNISGVAQAKLEKYGDAFLDVIKGYCEKRDLKEITRPVTSTSSSRGGEITARTRIVAEAFNDGKSVRELMQQYGVKANTILDHLNKYLLAGNKLRSDNDLQSLSSATPDQQQAVFAAFDEISPTFLKPVFDRLNSDLNYDELKILRMLYLITNQDNDEKIVGTSL
jgi:ATP-dependent DNA helicase RecQ